MADLLQILKSKTVLVVGQLKTSRTETLEEYLKGKVGGLYVFGFSSPMSRKGFGRLTQYHSAEKVREKPLSIFSTPNHKGTTGPAVLISFFLTALQFFRCFFKLPSRPEVFIGVATYSTVLGILLKKFNCVDRVIFYCLDYSVPSTAHWFANMFIHALRRVDAWVIKNSDMVWDITSRIGEARKNFDRIPLESYNPIVVPLGYGEGIERFRPFEERERWTLGFVGTLSSNQGLELIVDSLPELKLKIPQIKLRIIGDGPAWENIQMMVRERGVQDCVVFHGFIQDDEEVYDLLSHCMIGLAVWTGGADDNSHFADPGKPKLYALLGLPIVITDAPQVSEVIKETNAGRVIRYDRKAFVNAVEEILLSTEELGKCLEGLRSFKSYCRAEQIFDEATTETMKRWKQFTDKPASPKFTGFSLQSDLNRR